MLSSNCQNSFSHWQIPIEISYVFVTEFSPHLNCVATLPYKIRKYKVTAELYSYHLI